MKMFNGFVLTISFFSPSLYSSYECIGLGERCTVAAALEVFNLRKAAYPFDWTISEYDSLCAVLEEDFDNFLHPDFLSLRPDNHGVINKYGIVFVHDFPTTDYTGDFDIEAPLNEDILHQHWREALAIIQEKYARRIQRFRDICSSNIKVYFIRHQGIQSREQACALRNIIRRIYPNLDFTLVIVGNDNSFAKPWNIPNIKNYYLKQTIVWNDVKEWEIIFNDLGLIRDEIKKTNVQEKMDYYHTKYSSYLKVEPYEKI